MHTPPDQQNLIASSMKPVPISSNMPQPGGLVSLGAGGACRQQNRQNRPILLSIGYSACHWCHVMERESFENEAIAALMNRHFVCIKVDREERPDLDEIYMQATVTLNHGQGGWPMTVFLTPDQKPFFAGTYFPPEDRWGRPGFPSLLKKIADDWETDSAESRKPGASIDGTVEERTDGGVSRLSQRIGARCGRHPIPRRFR